MKDMIRARGKVSVNIFSYNIIHEVKRRSHHACCLEFVFIYHEFRLTMYMALTLD